MIKKLIVSFCLFVSAAAFAQQNNASPYSYYGIGDVKFRGTVENSAMGGLGIIPDSIHINMQNPATYNRLALTTFTIAGSSSLTTLKTETEKDNASRTTVDYLAVAIPFKRVGFAFGLMPYSSVGYKIQNTIAGDDGLERLRRFEGNGGLNRVFAGASVRLFGGLSLGADFQYNFGNIETRSVVDIPGNVQYKLRERNESEYSGASFNVGLVYQAKINKYDWYTSATYTPESSLQSNTQRETATISVTSAGNEVVVDAIEETIADDDVKLPGRYSFGTGFGEKMKWFAGAEYTYQESNELGNRFDNVTAAGFEPSHKFALGGYYTPNYMSFRSYFSRMTYRAGLKYEKTGLVINNQSINDYGLTLGAGFPLSGVGGSNLNLALEYGRRGTTDANLVQENYFNISVSLSFSDRWFIKRKYD